MSGLRKIIGVGIVTAAVGAGGYFFFRGESGAPEAPANAAALATVEKRNLEVSAEAAGAVEPVRVVEVKSKASGEVLEVAVETGDRVEEGALLATIDPRDVQSALEQAQADLSSARVKFSTADAHRKRLEALRGSGVVTQQELESAVQAAATARAEVVRAQTNLRLARERRQDVTIRAPIAGTILERTVEPGGIIASATSNVSGGTTLFKMADLSQMQVRAKIDESDVGRIQPGQVARVTVEAYPGRTFAGEIAKIEPQAVVEQNVTLFPVLVRLENRGGLLRPGMNAEVTVELASRRDVATVPNSAVATLREARSAAATVGLDPEVVMAAVRPPRDPSKPADAEDPCSALREKIRAAGGPQGLSPEDRTKLTQCRPGRGAEAGGDGVRAGLVFVSGPSGVEPRRVRLGVSDWEFTEVVEGVNAGEQVVLLSVAQLQQKQQQMTDRFRQRTGGVVPGAGGGRPAGGGRGR